VTSVTSDLVGSQTYQRLSRLAVDNSLFQIFGFNHLTASSDMKFPKLGLPGQLALLHMLEHRPLDGYSGLLGLRKCRS